MKDNFVKSLMISLSHTIQNKLHFLIYMKLSEKLIIWKGESISLVNIHQNQYDLNSFLLQQDKHRTYIIAVLNLES